MEEIAKLKSRKQIVLQNKEEKVKKLEKVISFEESKKEHERILFRETVKEKTSWRIKIDNFKDDSQRLQEQLSSVKEHVK